MNDKIKLYPLLLNLPRIRSVVMEWCKGEGRVVSNRGGWQSDLFYHIPVELKELFDIVDHNVDVIHSSSVLKLEEFWINVNKPNDSNSPHTHHDITPPLTDPGISGVFYIDIPKEDDENCGAIEFIRNDSIPYHLPLKGIPKYTPITGSSITVAPAAGRLLLFPSWVNHTVGSNRSQETRISMSFNYGL